MYILNKRKKKRQALPKKREHVFKHHNVKQDESKKLLGSRCRVVLCRPLPLTNCALVTCPRPHSIMRLFIIPVKPTPTLCCTLWTFLLLCTGGNYILQHGKKD